MGVCGGVGWGRLTGCEELAAVTIGTWPRVGVGLLVTAGVCTDDMVAIEDWELDRAGLPGRTVKKGAAGEGRDGRTAGGGLVRDGEAALIGVGTGVLFEDEVDRRAGLWRVGCGPEYI